MRKKLSTALLLVLSMLICFTATAFAACPCLYDPTVIAIQPNTGFNTEAVKVVIIGTKFKKGATVKLTQGSQAIIASDVVVVSKTQISCGLDLKGKTVGKWDVTVTNTDKRFATLKNGFTIEYPAPTVTSLSPNNGLVDTVVPVTITGKYFRKGATTKLIGSDKQEIALSKVNVGSDVQITAEANLANAIPGVYDLKVTNDDGKSAILVKAFTVVKPEPTPTPTPVATPTPTPVPTPVPTPTAPPISAIQFLKPVFFDYDKDNIRADQTAVLDENINVLKANPTQFVVLAGNADQRGSQAYNLDLSKRRAESVKKYLLAHGIDSSRIIIYFYGKDFPAKTGNDESAWSYNRRVDVGLWNYQPTKDEVIKQH